MTNTRKASYVLFALMALGAVLFKLGPLILSGLFSFMILDLTYRRLVLRLRPGLARWLSLLIFTISAVSLFWLFGSFIRQSLSTLPAIAAAAIPKIILLAETYGIDVPFDNLYELKEIVIQAIKTNSQGLAHASGLLTRGFFHVVVGIFVAILCFMTEHPADYQPNLYDSLRKELNARITTFMRGFEKVLGAQVTISGINTVITAIFLISMRFPFLGFLIPATFILGCLPLVGGVLSNTIICATALNISHQHAAFSLAFLVVIHKLEYLLNSHVMGSSINAPMWQTLLGILVGEVVMGVPGIVLAPAMLHYIKDELQAIPAATR
jgi:predicted PurR-regulated permease PerM